MRQKFSRGTAASIIVVMALFGIYASIVILGSSVNFQEERHFCLLDDAMISMRYARNLSNGVGLVWNAGERVEGITNPGWTFIMALVHLVEENRARTSFYVQMISAACLIFTIWITARLAWRISGGSFAVTVSAAAMTAGYYPLNYFSLYGMETGIVALLLTGSVALWVRQTDQGHFPWISYLMLGAATIVRIDAAVPLMVIGLFGFILSAEMRWRHAIWLLGTVIVFVGGQTLARLLYYGYPFPNTYYLKMTGFPVVQRMARGAAVTWTTVWTFSIPLLVIWVAGGLVYVVKHKKLPLCHITFRQLFSISVLPAALFLSQAAYSIYVGGDAWEWNIYCNRYMVIAIPLLMVSWWLLIVRSLQFLSSTCSRRDVFPHWLLAVILLVCGLFINYRSCRAPTLLEAALVKPATIREDNENALKIVQFLSKAPEDARISSDWAGAVPYFLDRYAVDPLGKCDEYIAHLPITQDKWESRIWHKAFYPGHMKWDFEHTWRAHQPDYMVFRWGKLALAFRKVLGEKYTLVDDEMDLVFIFERVAPRTAFH